MGRRITAEEAWQDCAEPDCPRKACRALSSRYCFEHTPGDERIKRGLLAVWIAEHCPPGAAPAIGAPADLVTRH